MSLYAALPYLAAALAVLALWQAVAAPDSVAGRVLRTAALAALAAFAFGRGTAPSTLAAALVLSTIAVLIPPKGPPQWRPGSDFAVVLAGLAYGYLFFKDGPGLQSVHEPARWPILGLGVLVAAAMLAFGFTLGRRRSGVPGSGADIEAGGLAFMAVTVGAVRFEHWPAMVGAVLVIAGQALAGWAAHREEPPRWPAAALFWLLAFCGHTAIALPFLR